MPLPPPTSPRTSRHVREIRLEAFEREDGLWDVEARLTDRKPFDLPLARGGVRPANQAVHDLHLRITIDTRLNVVGAVSHSESVPYPGYCERINPDYGRLVGLNLMKGFRQGVKERFNGIDGCTHLSELATLLPTAAIQAFAGTVFRNVEASNPSHKPFQLDRCHALRTDGDAVRAFYPRWYAPSGAPASSASAQPPADPASGASSSPSSEARIDR